jgi:hypothetical protein
VRVLGRTLDAEGVPTTPRKKGPQCRGAWIRQFVRDLIRNDV